ncbi:MAG: penicillin-binding transpeptidase domain-containing protein [Thermodesulfobacteriota bacterium]
MEAPEPNNLAAPTGAPSRPSPLRNARRRARAQQRRRNQKIFLLFSIMFFAACVSLAVYSVALVASPGPRPESAATEEGFGAAARLALTSRDVAGLLSGERPWEWPENTRSLTRHGETFTLKSTLDRDLQSYLESKLDTRHSAVVALAAVDPDTGNILALVGDGEAADGENPCLRADYPAASVFKMITAAAAVEAHDLTGDELIAYRGNDHTLYRYQVGRRESRRSRNTTLENAFARSINPVFGKIGIYLLGHDLLKQKAESFGFGKALGSELPVETSRAPVPDDDFGIAECASGYNRETRISPLHGALLAAAAVNGGLIFSPAVIDSVYAENGDLLYKHLPEVRSIACSPKAAERLGRLMTATVTEGTARKTFRRAERDPVLSELIMGGKTGTISNGEDKNRLLYDWFVGYARRPEDGKKLAIACLVVHDKVLGTKAAKYARWAFTRYFEDNLPG